MAKVAPSAATGNAGPHFETKVCVLSLSLLIGVEVFRAILATAGALTDNETIWRLLRLLVFDFESYGSDYDHRARARARLALILDQASRAGELWPILIEQVGASARAGGHRSAMPY